MSVHVPSTRRSRLLGYGHWWWALPGILVVLAIHYVATTVGGFFAFTDWTGIGSFNLIGLDNFVKIFQDPTKVGALTNTLFLAFASVILTNVFGLLLALALNRGLKTRFILRVVFFMPVVLSPLAVSFIWKFIFDYNGPINAVLTAVGQGDQVKAWLADPNYAIWAVLIVITWQNTGFAMVIYLAGLASVPVEIEEAAALDGAGLWGPLPARRLPGDPAGGRDRDHAGTGQRPPHLRPDHGTHRGRALRRDRDSRDPGLQADLRARELRFRRRARADPDRHHPGLRRRAAARLGRPEPGGLRCSVTPR